MGRGHRVSQRHRVSHRHPQPRRSANGTASAHGPEGAAAAGRPATPAEAPATVAEAPASLAAGAARDPRLAGWLEPLRSTWSGRAVLALVIPALLLVVAIFA